MNILLLEDDNQWAGEIAAQIKAAFPNSKLTHCATEWAFRKLLEQRPLPHFDLALFDIMVRWADYFEITEQGAMESVPPEVELEFDGKEKWRAGVRCRRLFLEVLESLGCKPAPCIFFSLLGSNELKEDLTKMNGHAPLVVKSEGDLIRTIRETIHNR